MQICYEVFHVDNETLGKEFLYRDFAYTKRLGRSVKKEYYKRAYQGAIEIASDESVYSVLDRIYTELSRGLKGKSGARQTISVSDVIVMPEVGAIQAGAYYNDVIGYVNVSTWNDESMNLDCAVKGQKGYFIASPTEITVAFYNKNKTCYGGEIIVERNEFEFRLIVHDDAALSVLKMPELLQLLDKSHREGWKTQKKFTDALDGAGYMHVTI